MSHWLDTLLEIVRGQVPAEGASGIDYERRIYQSRVVGQDERSAWEKRTTGIEGRWAEENERGDGSWR